MLGKLVGRPGGNVQRAIGCTNLKLMRQVWSKYINLDFIHKGKVLENWHKVKRAEESELHK